MTLHDTEEAIKADIAKAEAEFKTVIERIKTPPRISLLMAIVGFGGFALLGFIAGWVIPRGG